LKKLGVIIAVLGSFLLLFFIVNVLHFRFFPVHVVLYDSLLDMGIAGLAMLMLCIMLRQFLPLTSSEAVLTIALGAALAINYAIAVPTIIDRSLSIYILEKLAQRGGSIQYAAFDDIIIKEFVPEHHLVDIRLTEQLNSGTISILNGCVRLTRRGKLIAQFSKFFRNNILPKKREIMGSFTDALTDPFRNSKKIVDSDCAADSQHLSTDSGAE
jgi:hypothetical protein